MVGMLSHTVTRFIRGKEKYDDRPIVITTWQSIYKLERSWFERFEVVIGDEAHLFKSKSLIQIMTKLHHAKYRFGFTGTLDGTQTHKWVLEGLFGPSYKVTRTDELMRQGHLSQLDIQCLVLKHPPQKFEVYDDEIQYLISHQQRNKFITNLSLDLKGNTLVLFARVEAHGQVLYDQINKNKSDDRKVFFVHGGVDAEERELVERLQNEKTTLLSLPLMELLVLVSILKTSIMLSLPLQVSPESEIFRVLDEFLEKEKEK